MGRLVDAAIFLVSGICTFRVTSLNSKSLQFWLSCRTFLTIISCLKVLLCELSYLCIKACTDELTWLLPLQGKPNQIFCRYLDITVHQIFITICLMNYHCLTHGHTGPCICKIRIPDMPLVDHTMFGRDLGLFGMQV